MKRKADGTVDRRTLPRKKRQAGPTEREEEMIAMRLSGHPLDAIGKRFGVTRERVRQLLAIHGAPARGISPGVGDVDVVRLLRVIRTDPTITTIKAAVEQGGGGPGTLNNTTRALKALGLHAAVFRLLRWRKGFVTRSAMKVAVRAFMEQHGRIPYGFEMGTMTGQPRRPELPQASHVVTAFGSMTAFWKSLGVEPRNSGGNAHRIPTNPYRNRPKKGRTGPRRSAVKQPRGPMAETLAIEGDWQAAVQHALKAGKPPRRA